ncbi:MAG: OpgC domain-containing protein [Armatimonadetes bacterium]|nr:OpgC domain-containing protein [Armatimonadota bacterium]
MPSALLQSPSQLTKTLEISASTDARSQRNLAIDVLRGYCIVMMVTSHLATDSLLNNAVHFLRYISGAEGFVFLSGVALGLAHQRRVVRHGLVEAYRLIWRRASIIWLVHVATVFIAIGIDQTIHRYHAIPSLSGVGWPWLIWSTLTLSFQPGEMLNILPLYVFLLLGAPLVLEFIRRRWTIPLLIASASVFLYTQWHPAFGTWNDPLTGRQAFPAVTWQALFIPGMVIGSNRVALHRWVNGPKRRIILWGVGLLAGLTALVILVPTPLFTINDHMRWDLFIFQRHPLRFGRIIYFYIEIAAFYFAAQAWINGRLPRLPVQFLSTLGRNSLYSFLIHLVIAMVLAALFASYQTGLMGDIITIIALWIIYWMAEHQIGRRIIPN